MWIRLSECVWSGPTHFMVRRATGLHENKECYLQEAGKRGLTHSETDKDWSFIRSWALQQKKHPVSSLSLTEKPPSLLHYSPLTRQQHPTMHCRSLKRENGLVWLDSIQAAGRGVGGCYRGSWGPNHNVSQTMGMICYRSWACWEFSNETLSVFFSSSSALSTSRTRSVTLSLNDCTFSQAQGNNRTSFFFTVTEHWYISVATHYLNEQLLSNLTH